MTYRIGVDVGGTGIKAGVVDENGTILAKVSCPTEPERGPETVIADMAKLCGDAAREAGVPLEEILSIGIGVPGINDPIKDVVPFLTNLGWHETPMKQILQRYINKPVYIANDATVAALAESVAGAGKGTASCVLVTLGTGVGGGLILDGKPYSGAHGVGTEIGHMVIEFTGVMCSCRHRGCLERYASASALIRMGREEAQIHPDGEIARLAGGDMNAITAKTVVDAARTGDEDASRLFREYVQALCVGLANLVNVYDPEVILLGGGVSAAGDFLLDAVRAELPAHIFYTTMPYARVELARLGNDAGIIGASMLQS